VPEPVAGPDDCLSRLERVQSAHLPQVLAAFLAHFRRLTGGNTLASLSTLRSGMKFLDPDGTVALQIVVKAHLSADLATVACISSHVRPAPLHELHAQACTNSLVREKLGFSVLTILEIRVADVNTFGIPLSVTLQGTHESFLYVEQRLC